MTHLARIWWTVALRGLLALLFGALAITWPGITVAVFVLLFGAYALVDGVFTLVLALAGGVPNRSIDTLNSLLRGELAATETYQQALEKVRDEPWADDLRRIHREHREAANTIR